MQETPVVWVWMVPSLGVFGTIDQAVPFHDSARVAGEGPEAALAWPTALHVVALKQDTPVSSWLNVGGGVGARRDGPRRAAPGLDAGSGSSGPVTVALTHRLAEVDAGARDAAQQAARRGAAVPASSTSVQVVPFHTSLKADAVVRPACRSRRRRGTRWRRHSSSPRHSGTGVVAGDGGVAAVVKRQGACRSTGCRRWCPCRRPRCRAPGRGCVATHETEVRRDVGGTGGQWRRWRASTAVPFHVSAIGTGAGPADGEAEGRPDAGDGDERRRHVVADGVQRSARPSTWSRSTLRRASRHRSPRFCSPTADAERGARTRDVVQLVRRRAGRRVRRQSTAPRRRSVGWWGSPRRRALRSRWRR